MLAGAIERETASNRAEGDVDILVRERFFTDGVLGLFIEVGAARPDYLSVGQLYRDLGWRVLSIEPNPVYAELHRALGNEIIECACGDRDADSVPFLIADSHGAEYEGGAVSFESFSSLALKDEYAAIRPDHVELKSITVKLRRLDTILADNAPDREIDIICADVEGWELEVLSGLTFDRYKPKVLIIENMFSDRKYRIFMAARGYALWRSIDYNEVYARRGTLSLGERIGAQIELVDRAINRFTTRAKGWLRHRLSSPARRLASG